MPIGLANNSSISVSAVISFYAKSCINLNTAVVECSVVFHRNGRSMQISCIVAMCSCR
jgi:hypothetical protein